MPDTPPILPAGTRVVTRLPVRAAHGRPIHPAGAVGVVIAPPADATHGYRVRFPDGFEASLKRGDLSLLRRHADAPPNPLGEHDLWACVIYRCVIGSRAYGLSTDASDTDRRGVYLPPTARHWSIFGVPEQLENDATQEVYWELQKFLTLALKANPNVLECLWTPLIEHADPIARELLERRQMVLSRLVYQTFNGYVLSQFKKLQADLRNKGEPKPKHVMHLIRLLLAGLGTLRTGEVPVRVPDEHRGRLMAIRRGEYDADEVERWRISLHEQLDAAVTTSPLPDRPDYAAGDDFLVRARRSAVGAA